MLPTVPLLRAGGVYNSLDVQDITPAQGGEVVAQITMSNSGLIKRDLLDLKKSRKDWRTSADVMGMNKILNLIHEQTRNGQEYFMSDHSCADELRLIDLQ